jgi:hypothetical protein
VRLDRLLAQHELAEAMTRMQAGTNTIHWASAGIEVTGIGAGGSVTTSTICGTCRRDITGPGHQCPGPPAPPPPACVMCGYAAGRDDHQCPDCITCGLPVGERQHDGRCVYCAELRVMQDAARRAAQAAAPVCRRCHRIGAGPHDCPFPARHRPAFRMTAWAGWVLLSSGFILSLASPDDVVAVVCYALGIVLILASVALRRR